MRVRVPAVRATARDSTGAGDAFTADAMAGVMATPLMVLGDVDTLHVRVDVDDGGVQDVRGVPLRVRQAARHEPRARQVGTVAAASRRPVRMSTRPRRTYATEPLTELSSTTSSEVAAAAAGGTAVRR